MTHFDQRFQQVDTQYNAGRDINLYPLSLNERQRKRNHARMLQRVQAIWIEGVLEPSLHGAAQIALELQHQSGATVTPLWQVLREFRPTGPLAPVDTSISQVFDHAGGEVLILGEPGAGKTTLLLELTRALLERARQDESHPIPVVFNLSSWVTLRQPLSEWLAAELTTKYQVPRLLATSWIETDQVLPLLDGLDEVVAQHRVACVEAINAYRRTHGLLPTVVCSRQSDYLALSTRLLLRTAVVVQPLTGQQIETYLTSTGEQMAVLRQALQEDAELQILASTPLMLNVLTVAYQGTPHKEIAAIGSLEMKQEQIFATYVQRMLARRSISTRFTPTQTIHWLSWLAWQMKHHNQAEFYIERMQPDWLEDHQFRRLSYRTAVRLSVVLVSGLVGGLVVGGLIVALSLVPVSGLLGELLNVLVAGLITGLIYRVEREIKPAEVVFWSWRSMWRSVVKIEAPRSGLLIGLPFGLLFVRSAAGLSNGLKFGLLVGLLGGLVSRMVSELLGDTPDRQPLAMPNQKRRRTARHRVLVGLASGLVIGPIIGLLLGLGVGLSNGLFFGLVVGLLFGVSTGLVGGLVIALTHRVETEKGALEMGVWLWVGIWPKLVKSESLRTGLLIGGLLFVLLTGLHYEPPTPLVDLLVLGLTLGPLSVLVLELISGIIGGLSSDTLDKSILTRPNQGIRNSARNSIFVGLVGWVVTGLFFGLFFELFFGLFFGLSRGSVVIGLLYVLVSGLFIWLPLGLSIGGVACIQHAVLRWFLWHTGYAPLNYLRFLDYAAERILLRKVGGGYIFVHRLLRDYFADLEVEPVSVETAERGQETVSPVDVSSSMPTTPTVPDVLANLPALSLSSAPSDGSRLLPCGHEQRSNARFCSVCGAPVPS